MCKHYIYALVNPISNKIFYIGRSVNPQRRLKQHLSEKVAKKTNKKLAIINDILCQGQTVKMVILDIIDTDNIKIAEKLEEAWVAQKTLEKHPLVNHKYSRRMSPKWYVPKNKNSKFSTPMEYIKLLKQGIV